MQRFFQVLLVAAIVLVGLVLALTTGYGGNWYVSISLAIVGVAVLIFLALSKRTALILVATMVMFAQSLQFWFGEYNDPLPELLGTLVASVLVGGGLHPFFRDRRWVRVWVFVVGSASLVLSYIAWDRVKIITEYMHQELLALMGGSLIATVALADNLREPATSRLAPGEGLATLTGRQKLGVVAGLATLIVAMSIVQSETRSDMAKAEARLDCDRFRQVSSGWDIDSPTPEEAIGQCLARDRLFADLPSASRLGPRYGEGAYEVVGVDGKTLAVGWVRETASGSGGYRCDQALVCEPYPSWSLYPGGPGYEKWRKQHAGNPFRIEIVVDTEQGTMTVSENAGERLYLDEPLNPALFDLGLEFRIAGHTGSGPITVIGSRPDGTLVLDERIEPSPDWFYFPDTYVAVLDASGLDWYVPTVKRFRIVEPGRYRLAVEAPQGSPGIQVSVGLSVLEPEPLDLAFDQESCQWEAGTYRATGSLTNRDSRPHSYRVLVDFTSVDGEQIVAWTDVEDLAPEEAAVWAVSGPADAPFAWCEVGRIDIDSTWPINR